MSNLAYQSIPIDLPNYDFKYVETVEKLKELWLIDSEVYGDCSIEMGTFRNWWERYPQGSLNLCENGQIIASIGIYPLDAEQFELFVDGQIREEELLPVKEEECERTPQNHWYFSGIVLHQERRLTRNNPLRMLISVALGSWSDRVHVAYPAKWCAQGYSVQGQNMLNRFGFELARKKNLLDGYPIYLDSVRDRQDVISKLMNRGLLG